MCHVTWCFSLALSFPIASCSGATASFFGCAYSSNICPAFLLLKIFFTLPTLFWGSRCVTGFAAWHRHILVLCSTRIRRAAIIFMDIPHLNLPCMRCVRSALKAIEEGDTMPLRIRCRFEQASSFKCAQCIKRKDTGCITVRIDADVGGPID